MGKVNRDFNYTSAEDSQKPNYLRNRFAAIRKAQREQAERERATQEAVSVEQLIKVRVLKGTQRD